MNEMNAVCIKTVKVMLDRVLFAKRMNIDSEPLSIASKLTY